jgi:KH domain-containing protein
MARTLTIENVKKIRAAIPLIESKIKIKIESYKNSVSIIGDEYDEYLVEKILEAIDFGFDSEDALLLSKEDFGLDFVNIKEHTHRKNLKDVRARLIGKDGKVKTAIEELTGGMVVINANRVGIIADNQHLTHTIQGIKSLIQGSKHGNVFAYLEKQNANLHQFDEEDLGLKILKRKKNS